jgi:CNT family concentrative nucleoside transporter
MQAFLGIAVLLGVAYVVSEARHSIAWRFVGVGLVIQFVFAFVFIKVPVVAEALLYLNYAVQAIESATKEGTDFLFGFLGGGADTPFTVTDNGAMYLFAFRVLPQVIVFSVIVAVLWHWRILPAIVRGFGWALQRALNVGGALGTSAAASLILGMVETPLVIRAYLKQLTRSEFFTVMTCGMATVAGSVMVLYANLLFDVYPGVVGHILSASVINVIGAVYIARILVPELDEPTTVDAGIELKYNSLMDAITRGTQDGLSLAMNVGAMLLVLISLIALVNSVLGWVDVAGAPLSLQRAMGWAFAPIAWLIGIPWSDALTAGSLMGTKLVLNELVAYIQLADSYETLSEPSRLILLYALCGFANFGSLGILLGGLNTLVPERRDEYLSIAPKSLMSGTLVTLITGAIVALISQI